MREGALRGALRRSLGGVRVPAASLTPPVTPLDDMHRTGIPPVVMAYAVMVVLLLLPALVGALG